MAILGLAIGGGAGTGFVANLVLSAGLIGLSFLLPRPKIEGPRLDSIKVTADSVGQAIPKVWGRAPITGRLTWIKDNELQEVKETESGKGGGPTTVTWLYFATFMCVCCDNELFAFERIWFDEHLVYNINNDSGPVLGEGLDMTIYLGTDDQEPDPLMVSILGEERVPGYRGVAHIVVNNYNLEKHGNRIPNIRFTTIERGTADSNIYPFAAQGSSLAVDKDRNLVYSWVNNLDGTGTLSSWNLFSGALVDTLLITVPSGTQNGVTLSTDGGTVYLGGGSGGAPGENTVGASVDTGGVFINLTTPNGSISLNHHGVGFSQYGFTVIGGQVTGFSFADGDATKWAVVTNLLQSSLTVELRRAHCIDVSFHFWFSTVADYTVSKVHIPTLITAAVAADPTTHSIDAVPYVITYSLGTLTGGLTQPRILFGDYSESLGLMCWIIFDAPTGKHYALKTDTNMNLVAFTEIMSSSLEAVNSPNVRLSNNQVAIQSSSSTAYIWNFNTMTKYMDFSSGVSVNSFSPYWLADKGIIVYPGYGGSNIVDLFGATPTEVPISDILTDMSTFVGIPSARIDTTLINSNHKVNGYFIDSQSAMRDSLDDVSLIWLVDVCDDGDKLKFITRGNNQSLSISEGFLRPGENEIADNISTENMLPPYTIPKSMTLEHYDPQNRLEKSIQGPISRPAVVVPAEDLIKVSTRCVMTPSKAAQQMEKIFRASWRKRFSYTLPLDYTLMRLHPGDVLIFPKNGELVTMLIDSIRSDLALFQLEGSMEDLARYESDAVGISGGHSEDILSTYAKTLFYFLDTHALREEDVNQQFYTAAYPASIAAIWSGASFYRSTDGSSFAFWVNTDDKAITGKAQDVLGTHPYYELIDEVNTVTIYIPDTTFTPESVDLATFMSDIQINPLMLQSNGTSEYELIRYRTVTSLGGNLWRLSNLKRGQRGTEQFMTHAINDLAFFPSPTTMDRIGEVADVNLLRYYKAVTWGAQLSSAASTSFTNTGRGVRPLAPSHVKGDWDYNAGTVLISWKRRQKKFLQLAWDNTTGTALDESLEHYKLVIKDGSTVVRTIDPVADTTEYTYSAANILSDFGTATPATINIEVQTKGDLWGYGLKGSGVATY